MKEQRHRER